MVVEAILFPLKAEKKPWEMFFIGFLYTTLGIFLSLWIFNDSASLVMVFMITMAALPIFYNTMRYEESKDLLMDSEKAILHEHSKAISFFMFLFVGITLACSLWYVVLPEDTVINLFEKQMGTYHSINNNVSGNAISSLSVFTKIFFNNFKVLAFSILFSFIFGAGAIFILTWNATVIGSVIGYFIKLNIDSSNIVHNISVNILKYSFHGVPEVMAYIYGALAGGIISMAIIRKHFKSEKFPAILIDFSELVLIAVGFLIAAAFLEVYITPVLF